jgi:hypothetical protein
MLRTRPRLPEGSHFEPVLEDFLYKDPQLVRKPFRLRAPEQAHFQPILGDAKGVSIPAGSLQMDLRSSKEHTDPPETGSIKAEMFTTFGSVAKRCEWRWTNRR